MSVTLKSWDKCPRLLSVESGKVGIQIGCAAAGCKAPITAHVVAVSRRKIVTAGYYCDIHGLKVVEGTIAAELAGIPPAKVSAEGVCCDLSLIMDRPEPDTHRFRLKELGGSRWLAIDCSWVETATMVSAVKTEWPRRPFMHDTLAGVVRALNGSLEHVTIHSVTEDGQDFLASIGIETQRGLITVDTQPADAVSLAIRAGVPIFVAEELLQ